MRLVVAAKPLRKHGQFNACACVHAACGWYDQVIIHTIGKTGSAGISCAINQGRWLGTTGVLAKGLAGSLATHTQARMHADQCTLQLTHTHECRGCPVLRSIGYIDAAS